MLSSPAQEVCELESWQHLELALMPTCRAALDMFFYTCVTSVIVVEL